MEMFLVLILCFKIFIISGSISTTEIWLVFFKIGSVIAPLPGPISSILFPSFGLISLTILDMK